MLRDTTAIVLWMYRNSSTGLRKHPPELVVVRKAAYNTRICRQDAAWQGFVALRDTAKKCCAKSNFGQRPQRRLAADCRYASDQNRPLRGV
jgi:hypothetical protein